MNTTYKVIRLPDGRQAYEHRVVWENHHGAIPSGHHVHHRNGDRRDNRIENLELLSSHDHHQHHFIEQGATKEHKERASKNLGNAWDSMGMLRLRCVVCDSAFEKRQHLSRGVAKYCSPKCRSKDYYKTVTRPKLQAAAC